MKILILSVILSLNIKAEDKQVKREPNMEFVEVDIAPPVKDNPGFDFIQPKTTKE